jgi:hypothetical protein
LQPLYHSTSTSRRKSYDSAKIPLPSPRPPH